MSIVIMKRDSGSSEAAAAALARKSADAAEWASVFNW